MRTGCKGFPHRLLKSEFHWFCGTQCYSIGPLGMVDDIICVTNVEKSEHMNSLINTFIESKNLTLSAKKCFQIHIGKGHQNCPKLRVHETEMKKADHEKYLGDVVDQNNSTQATLENRKSKGQGINTAIMSILNEVPLGRHRIEVGMKLREVMLLNGVLYNSEAWHGVTKNHVHILEAIDEDLLRKFLKAHSKTPKEFLYLETGATPIKWIIAQRRINYLKHILDRDKDELLSKVFQAQKEKPTSGDFVQLVEKDMEDLNISYEEVTQSNKVDLKKKLKVLANNASFIELKNRLKTHKKVRHIHYNSLQLQPYLSSPDIHKEEAHVISALRSQCVKTIRSNFSKMFHGRINCPLKCYQETPPVDTQEHLLTCTKIEILNTNGLRIKDVFGDLKDQENIGKLVLQILRDRKRILEEMETS